MGQHYGGLSSPTMIDLKNQDRRKKWQMLPLMGQQD